MDENVWSRVPANPEGPIGDNCVVIHHIGSTSVPRLDAKPIIDMIPVVRDILQLDSSSNAVGKMEGLGYIGKGENGIPFRRFFHKGLVDDRRKFHLYIFQTPRLNIISTSGTTYDKIRGCVKSMKSSRGSWPRHFQMIWTSILLENLMTSVLKEVNFHESLLRNCYTDFEWSAFIALLGGAELYANECLKTSTSNEDFYFVFYKRP